MNIYDLYRTQYGNNGPVNKTINRERTAVIDGKEVKYRVGHTASERTPFRRSLRSSKNETSNGGKAEAVIGIDMDSYLNRDDVRKALNIPSYIPPYEPCNNPMYETYQAFREGSIWIYNIMLGYSWYNILHYSGDTDGAVATLGTRRWIAQQGWNVTKEWRPWTTDGDLSGYLEDYGQFTFATVHGVGHMAPQWKRKDVTTLISKYVHNEIID